MERKRNQVIELLRILLLFSIIIGHIFILCPQLREIMLSFLHSNQIRTGNCCEVYFILSGFFLYENFFNGKKISEIIKGYYKKIIIPLLFVFLILCFTINDFSFSNIFIILSLLTGTGLSLEIIGWGDWFFGVLFWSIIFYCGLLKFFQKEKAIFLTGIIVSTIFTVIFHQDLVWQGVYGDYIHSEFSRGLSGVGLGVICGYLKELAPNLNKENAGIKIILSGIEIYLFMYLYNFLFRGINNSFISMVIAFMALLITLTKYKSYLSELFNKINFYIISKYSLAIFMGHILIVKYMTTLNNGARLNSLNEMIIVLIAPLIFALIEFHIVEKIANKMLNIVTRNNN